MGIERWVLKPVNWINITLLVVFDGSDNASTRLLANMLNFIGLNSEQVYVCESNVLESYLLRIKPRLILALGSVGAALLGDNDSLGTLRQKILSYRKIPLVETHDLLEVINKPRMKKTLQDDLAFIQAWLDS